MRKHDLKSGMLVTNRAGDTFVVVAGAWGGETGLLSHKECDMLNTFNDDLTHGLSRKYTELDIVEVWDRNGGWGLGVKNNLESSDHFGRTLLWRRPLEATDLDADHDDELFGA